MSRTTSDQEFLAGLTDLFLAEGVINLTVGEIAERMRCSRRRLYAIAQTKEEIFCAVVHRFFSARLEEGVALVRGQPDPTIALAAYLDIGVRAAGRMSSSFLLDIEAIESARAVFDAYQQARTTEMARLIDRGVSDEVFASCHGQVVAEIIFGAALRLRRPTFLSAAGLTIEQAFQEFYRVLLEGLLADGRRKSAAKPRKATQAGQADAKSSTTAQARRPHDEAERLLIAAWNRP